MNDQGAFDMPKKVLIGRLSTKEMAEAHRLANEAALRIIAAGKKRKEEERDKLSNNA